MSKQRCLPQGWKGNVESTWPFQQSVEGSLPLSMYNGIWTGGVSLPCGNTWMASAAGARLQRT
eukprot:7115168-Prorocentrum_lima.AAC.1